MATPKPSLCFSVGDSAPNVSRAVLGMLFCLAGGLCLVLAEAESSKEQQLGAVRNWLSIVGNQEG
jgi:hypothetical protein